MKEIDVGITNYNSLATDGGTHLFGTPVLTKALAKKRFKKEELFVGQINFADLAPFADGLKPSGMLYIFYDTFEHAYSLFSTKEEGTVPIDGFNDKFSLYGRFSYPLKLVFAEGEKAFKNKMFAELPQPVKDAYPQKKSGYKSIITLFPETLDYFERNYLFGVKYCSVIAAREKDILKNRFGGAVTLNV